MNLEYDTSKLIETLKTILRNYGDLTVFIQGQDSGGIYPNDYVKYKLGVHYESEGECRTILISLNEKDPFGETSTVSEFIALRAMRSARSMRFLPRLSPPFEADSTSEPTMISPKMIAP